MVKALPLYRVVETEKATYLPPFKEIKGGLREERWFCSKCGTIHLDKQSAEQCCKSVVCAICGKEIEMKRLTPQNAYHYAEGKYACISCWHAKKEKERPIVEWKDYNNEPIEYNESFYDCFDDFWSDYEPETEEDIPEFVTICEECKIDPIDIDQAFESACEQTGLEDAADFYKDVEELYEFVKKWNAKQTATYYVATDKKLRIPEQRIQEMKEWLNEQLF